MKELPIGRQTFSEFIEQDLLYVDKTRQMLPLVTSGKYYFFSRPRRFGKSLLLSTLKSFFEGREDLFRGLYIHDQVKKWKKHPVIHLSFGTVEYKSGTEVFQKSLLSKLELIAKDYQVEIRSEVVSDYFEKLIRALHENYGDVVVLIDEYDKAMVDVLHNPERFEENREVLRGLYGSMKDLDPYLRFVFLTGVSRFAKVGVFSGMNNLDDISINAKFSTLTGFTQDELEAYFSAYIERLQQKFNMPVEELKEHIRFWYNGFSWDGENRLYNPFSILSLFGSEEFGNYWFSTGTPTFLVNLIREQKAIPENLEGLEVTDLTGSSLNLQSLPLAPLLFQTGYLTVEKIIREGIRLRYRLNYPNEEVRHAFITSLLAGFIKKDEFDIQPAALHLRDALRDEDVPRFVQILTSFFADIPARLHIASEAYYHSLMYMLLRLVGVRLQLEKPTDKGYLDAVLELPGKVWVIEVKFDTGDRVKNVKTLTRQALRQIGKKNYHEPYLGSGKRILLLGLGFLKKEIDGKAVEWKAEG